MNDDDLVKLLCNKTPNMVEGHAAMKEAAERIKALKARLAEWAAANRGLVRLNEVTQTRAEAAEARVKVLENAVALVQRIMNTQNNGGVGWMHEFETLVRAHEERNDG
jgi:hypothetical protein